MIISHKELTALNSVLLKRKIMVSFNHVLYDKDNEMVVASDGNFLVAIRTKPEFDLDKCDFKCLDPKLVTKAIENGENVEIGNLILPNSDEILTMNEICSIARLLTEYIGFKTPNTTLGNVLNPKKIADVVSRFIDISDDLELHKDVEHSDVTVYTLHAINSDLHNVTFMCAYMNQNV